MYSETYSPQYSALMRTSAMQLGELTRDAYSDASYVFDNGKRA